LGWGVEFDLLLATEDGVLEAEGLAYANVATSPRARRLSWAATKSTPEKVREDVLKVRKYIALEACAWSAFQAGVPELIVSLPLLVVTQDLIGFRDRLEFAFRFVVALIAVRMELQS
jgi:hypothetical protein